MVLILMINIDGKMVNINVWFFHNINGYHQLGLLKSGGKFQGIKGNVKLT